MDNTQQNTTADTNENTQASVTELAEKTGLSRAMFYRNIDELRNMDYLTTDNKIQLTDAGKIAML